MSTTLDVLLQALALDPFDLMLHHVIADAYEERGGPDDEHRATAHRHIARGEWAIVYDNRAREHTGPFVWDLFLPRVTNEALDLIYMVASNELGTATMSLWQQVGISDKANDPYHITIRPYQGWTRLSTVSLSNLWTIAAICAQALDATEKVKP